MDGTFGIWRTYDGGVTWKNCKIPNGYDYTGRITDIFMRDSLNGWASIEQGELSNDLWYTNDGGVTWNIQANSGGLVSCVYETPSALVYTQRLLAGGNGISSSGNHGNNFNKKGSDRYNGLDFTDGLHGVASAFANPGRNSATAALWTSDGGISWNPTTGVVVEAWGVYGQKGSSNFYIVGEMSAIDQSGSEFVYVSSDNGMTWNPLLNKLGGRTTGHIAGVSTVMYVQSSYESANALSFRGLNRSTDGGVTWVNVGGPENNRDTRFSVLGCLGGIVYAFDALGNVFRTEDGGNGDIHEPPHNPNVNPNQLDLKADLCHSLDVNLNYNNLSCNSLQIQSIGFIDSTDPVVSSGALSFTRYPVLPQVLDPTKNDFLSLNWDPKKLGVAKALSTTYIKIHSTMFNGTMVFDTLIAVNTQSFAFTPIFSLSTSSVKFDSLNLCSRFRDTTISFTNGSCDSLWLQTDTLAGSKDWQIWDIQTLQPMSLPIGLAPNESASFLLMFTPSVEGAQKASLKLHFVHQGLSKDTTLQFSGSAYRVMNVAADPNIILPPTSICSVVDTAISFHNLNCDTLTIDTILNTNPADFTDITGITLPIKIPPNASLNYRLHYTPTKNVISSAGITFKYHLAQDSGVLLSSISGKGISGTSVFQTSSPTSLLAFADRVACTEPDSMVFMITNPGCDSLTVLSSLLSAAGLPAVSYATDVPLPATLSKPGDKIRVVIYLQSQNPSLNNGTLTFMYRTSDAVIHDSIFTLHAQVSRGVRLGVLSDQKFDLGSGTLCTSKDTEVIISNPGCPNLTITNINISGNYFSIANPKTTPIVLSQGGSDTIHISFDPATSGLQTGTLEVITDADINPTNEIPLTASARDISHIGFKLVPANTRSIFAGDTARFAFEADNDWTGEPVHAINFSVTINSDLLHYLQLGLKDPLYRTLGTDVKLSGNRSLLSVSLSGDSIMIRKDQPLVYIYYGTTLTDTISTSLKLSLLSLNNSDPHFLNCVLSPLSQDTIFSLDLECGNKTLIDYLNGKLPILSDGAHPNPITVQSNYQAVIPFTASVSGSTEFLCYDALGKIVSSQVVPIDKIGNYEVHFDGSKLSGGTYGYLLKMGSSVTRGRFVLLK
jgi:hypothetical protein